MTRDGQVHMWIYFRNEPTDTDAKQKIDLQESGVFIEKMGTEPPNKIKVWVRLRVFSKNSRIKIIEKH